MPSFNINVTDAILGVPFTGTAISLEKQALFNLISNLIKEGTHTVPYIIHFCTGMGYQKPYVYEVFKNITGFSATDIVNSNTYYQRPSFVPPMTIAWGLAKDTSEENPTKAFYIAPYEEGFALLSKDDINQPEFEEVFPVLDLAVEALKSKVKKVETEAKIIDDSFIQEKPIGFDDSTITSVQKDFTETPVESLKKSLIKKDITKDYFKTAIATLHQTNAITEEEAVNALKWQKKAEMYFEEKTETEDIPAYQKEIKKIQEADIFDTIDEDTPSKFFNDFKDEKDFTKTEKVLSELLKSIKEKLNSFTVKLISYRVNFINADDTTEGKEVNLETVPSLVEDDELQADTVISLVFDIAKNDNPDEFYKALSVFAVVGEKTIWDGTIKDMSNNVYALTEEGLNKMFEDQIMDVEDQGTI